MDKKTSVDVPETNEELGQACLTLEVTNELHKVKDIFAFTVEDNNNRQIFRIQGVTEEGKLEGRYLVSDADRKKVDEAILFLFVGKRTSYKPTKYAVYGTDWIREKYPGKMYDYGGIKTYQIGDLWFSVNNENFKFLGKGLRANIPGGVCGIIGMKHNGEVFLKKIENSGLSDRSISLPGKDISQLNESNFEFFTVSEGNILRIFLEDVSTSFGSRDTPIKYRVEGKYSFKEFGDVQKVDRDINRNFVLVVGKKGDKYTLYVLRGDRWTSGEVLTKIEGVKEFVTMEDGSLLGMMEDGKVRGIATTFSQFKKGYFEGGGNVVAGEDGVKIVKNNVHEKMLEALDSAKLDGGGDIEEVEEGLDVSEQDVISSFWSKKVEGEDKTIKELLDEAKTGKEFRKIEKQISKLLVSISSFEGSVKIKNHIIDIVTQKKTEILLNKLQEDINLAEKSYNEAQNIGDYIKLKSLIESLHEKRKNLGGNSNLAIESGKKIRELREKLDEKIKESKENKRDEILVTIEKNIEELKDCVGAIGYGINLSGIYNLDLWKETMELIDFLKEEDKKIWETELYSIVQKKSKELQEEEKKEGKNKQEKIEKKKKVIEEDINILINMLETVHNIEAINDMKVNDPLVKKIEEEIGSLSPSEGGELEIKYKKAFKDRIFNIRRENVKERGIIQNLDDSGIDTMLYYVNTQNEEVDRKLKGIPTGRGTVRLEISLDDGKRHYSGEDYFENSDEFSDVLIGSNIEFEVTQSEYIKLNNELSEWREYGKPKLQELLQKLKTEVEMGDGVVKVKSGEIDLPVGEVNPEDLVKMSEGDTVKFRDGRGVDKSKEGKEQDVAVIVNVGEQQKEMEMVITIRNGKMIIKSKKQQDILNEVKNIKSRYLKARYVEKLADRLINKAKLNPRSGVPKVDHDYIVLDEERQSLQELSGNLLNQKKRSGVTILEGGPGLGKTVMCYYLAAVTNREIVRVQCSKKISYSEFFFAPTLKKGDTSRNPAEWIKMMQKPGTIILFDEIDKLNAECMAGLHALFDSGRHVHDPQLGDFYANSDCLFLGTMNSYDPLPKAIASRATIQEIKYPGEMNEAYKISKYVDDDFLKELSYEEFKEVWASQDNEKMKTKNSKEHKLNEILHNIRKLLKVFNLLRKKYEDEYERFEYELSYRDAAQIFSAYNISHNFKKAVSDILINKASSVVGTESQKEQRDMVKQVIKQVFG